MQERARRASSRLPLAQWAHLSAGFAELAASSTGVPRVPSERTY